MLWAGRRVWLGLIGTSEMKGRGGRSVDRRTGTGDRAGPCGGEFDWILVGEESLVWYVGNRGIGFGVA